MTDMGRATVGIIGVGIMGSAIARHLLEAGFGVVVHDTSEQALAACEAFGARRSPSPAAVAEATPVVFTSLPTEAALEHVVGGPGGIAESGGTALLVELSTMSIATKERCRQTLSASGMRMLDCPVSGTGAQAARKDLVVFGSGDREAYDSVAAILPRFSRLQHYVGEFGNGSRMKFLANVLVNIHNVAAAEVFALGAKAGMDPALVYEILKDSAGASRMFQVRGPLMVDQDYDHPTARIAMYMKDLDIIGRFAAQLHCPMPLFSTAAQLYVTALNEGRGEQDLAAVCAVVERMAGVRR